MGGRLDHAQMLAGDKLATVAVDVMEPAHPGGTVNGKDRLPGHGDRTNTDLVPLWTSNIRGMAWQAWTTHTHNQE